MRLSLIRVGVGLLCIAIPTAAAAVDITTWGAVVPADETGVLLNDLDGTNVPGYCAPGVGSCTSNGDCPSGTVCYPSTYAVTLEPGARLEMNGHRIFDDNGSAAQGAGFGVNCLKGRAADRGPQCEVLGPGQFSGLQIAVYYSGSNVVRIEGVTFSDNHHVVYGVYRNPRGRLSLANVIATGNWSVTSDVKLLEGTNVTLTDNVGPLRASKLLADGLVVTGTQSAGLIARRVTLSNSTLSDNWPGIGVDILSARAPELTATSCQRSGRYRRNAVPPFPTWGVCALD